MEQADVPKLWLPQDDTVTVVGAGYKQLIVKITIQENRAKHMIASQHESKQNDVSLKSQGSIIMKIISYIIQHILSLFKQKLTQI